MKALVILFIGIIVIGGGMLLLSRAKSIPTGSQYDGLNKPSDNDIAIEKAKNIYEQQKNQGTDLSSGPCLAEELITDWSLDIVHNPRTSEDDNPANQCANYKSGKTHHFVELDTDGNLIRAL